MVKIGNLEQWQQDFMEVPENDIGIGFIVDRGEVGRVPEQGVNVLCMRDPAFSKTCILSPSGKFKGDHGGLT
jgi:hypothetical protein